MSEKKSQNGPTKAAGTSSKPASTPNPALPDKYSSGYDSIIANGSIDYVMHGELASCCSTGKANDQVVLALVTYGGEANSAFRIGRLLQVMYKTVVVFAPSLCKSAGTLIATAAHRLVISPFGEIGPLDVQLPQRDEIAGQRSGLTTRSALADLKMQAFDFYETFMLGIISRSAGSVSFKLASELAAKATSDVMSSVYSQINPENLGQDYRDLSVATSYGTTLAERSKNLRPDSIRRLVHDYPSHDYVIDFE